MGTTSLKLSDALKQRAIDAAVSQGLSPHAFMVRAIEQAAAAAEQRASFLAQAHEAREHMLQSDEGYAANDVHAWLKQRITDPSTSKPKASSWQR
ncbi:MAG: hypothetical protein H3C33_12210 [Rhodocyclaceae bacterium]|nr:hypothetical protein [Rhodocyclaceae bacterium]